MVVQNYQETLLRSTEFKVLAVFKVLVLIREKKLPLTLLAEFKVTTSLQVALVQSLENLETYSFTLTKQVLPLKSLTFEGLRDLSFQMLFKLILNPVIKVFSSMNYCGFSSNWSPHVAILKLQHYLLRIKKSGSTCVLLQGSISSNTFSDKIFLTKLTQKLPIPFKFRILFLHWLDLELISFKTSYLTTWAIPENLGILSGLLLTFIFNEQERLLSCVTHTFILKTSVSLFRNSTKLTVPFVSRFADQQILGCYSKFNAQVIRFFWTQFFMRRATKFHVNRCIFIIPTSSVDIFYLGYGILFHGITSNRNTRVTLNIHQESKLLFYRNLRRIFETSIHKSSYELISLINPVIKYWQAYFYLSFSQFDYQFLVAYIHSLCWRWIVQKHPKGSKNLLANYYFDKFKEKTYWVFRGYKKTFALLDFRSKVNYLRVAPATSIYCPYIKTIKRQI